MRRDRVGKKYPGRQLLDFATSRLRGPRAMRRDRVGKKYPRAATSPLRDFATSRRTGHASRPRRKKDFATPRLRGARAMRRDRVLGTKMPPGGNFATSRLCGARAMRRDRVGKKYPGRQLRDFATSRRFICGSALFIIFQKMFWDQNAF